ncbi:MAG: sulfate adenylyltransferase [Rhodospirillaceae bacterium]|nr:sulfate adenylyltransferase [Rhodospirillaceae bacterium]
MTPEAAAAAAQMIAEARWTGGPLGPLPEACYPATVADGYMVQAALHDIMAKNVMSACAGYKIGCTTEVMQDYLGIDHPCAGGILGTNIHQGDTTLAHADYCKVGAECEIVVKLSSDIPAGTNHTSDSVADHVGAVMVGIEIVDNRYTDFATVGAATLIGDDFFGAGCVLGEPVTDWRSLDLAELEGGLTINGEAKERATGAAIMGDPLEALAWLASHKTMTGGTLKAGEIVMLGSIVQCQWMDAPGEAAAEISGLGAVTLTLN